MLAFLRMPGFLVEPWVRFCSLCRAVVALRVPAVSAVVGIAIMQTGQMREVVEISIANDRAGSLFNPLTFSMVAACITSFAIWLVGRSVSLTTPNVAPGHYMRCLALLPVTVASGYLGVVMLTAWVYMQAAGQQDTATAWATFPVGVASALLCVLTAGTLAITTVVPLNVDGIVDGRVTHWFFGEHDPAGRPTDWARLPDVYFRLMRGITIAVRRGIRVNQPFNALADKYLPRQWDLIDVARVILPVVSRHLSQRDSPQTAPPRDVDLLLAFRTLISAVADPLAPIVIVPIAALTLAVPFVLAISTVLFCLQWPGISEFVGAAAIVQIFVLVLLVVHNALYRRSHLLIGVAVAALVCAAFDLNDTHHLRPLAGTPSGYESLEGAFPRWLEARGDRSQFSRYPVYVVAARGGGIYAAYHSALFLSRLQDFCPGFAQHVFAISSVSGGSLGGGVFAALARAHAVNGSVQGCRADAQVPGTFEQRTEEILASDFLAPVTSAALFPDLVLQLLPACAFDRSLSLCWSGFDRARALERAFERAWKSGPATADNPLARSFYRLWTPEGATPALLVNTTNVESGGRVVISPFTRFAASVSAQRGHAAVTTLLEHADDLDLRLSTAIGASARFPVITPAAWYRVRRGDEAGRKVRLVDGGYFDNSGIATALDAIDVISKVASEQHLLVEIRLIVLTGSSDPPRESYAFGEVLSMVRAVLNTRDEHGRRIEELARSRAMAPRVGQGFSVRYAVLDTGSHQLPLGWQLSAGSRRAIALSVGTPSETGTCPDAAGDPDAPPSALRVSSCTMTEIRRDLDVRRFFD